VEGVLKLGRRQRPVAEGGGGRGPRRWNCN
jgi:hypothetical protein